MKKKEKIASASSKSKKLRATPKSSKSAKGKGKGGSKSPKTGKGTGASSSAPPSSKRSSNATNASESSQKSKSSKSHKGAAPVPSGGGNATSAPTDAPNADGSTTDAPAMAETNSPSVSPTMSDAPVTADQTEAPTELPASSAPSESPVQTTGNVTSASTISIGNLRPESITTGDGSDLYFTNIFYGGVRKLDLSSNEITEVVPNVGFFERVSLGIKYDEGYLFVCGSGPAFGANQTIVYVYDEESGEEVAACTSVDQPGQLWNDIAIMDGTGYITDSRLNFLYTLDIEAAKNGECEIGTIELPPQFFLSETNINLANGKSALTMNWWTSVEEKRNGAYQIVCSM